MTLSSPFKLSEPSSPLSPTKPTALNFTNAYSTLGLSTGASQDEISRAFKLLAAKYHPDRPKGCPVLFAQISAAYDCISNPVTRALYDIEAGLVDDEEVARKRVYRLRRQEALMALKLMFNRVHTITQKEIQRDGLLIVSAKYGNIRSSRGGDMVDGVLDVTMQLQAMIADSLLILRGGSSKSWLEGFYDPTQGGDNQLQVIYKLGSDLHAVEVDDLDELIIPQQDHLLDEQQTYSFRSHFALDVDRIKEASIKRKRRYITITSLALLGTGAYFYYRYCQNTKKTTGGTEEAAFSAVDAMAPACKALTAGGQHMASIVAEWLEYLTAHTQQALQTVYQQSSPLVLERVKQLRAGAQ